MTSQESKDQAFAMIEERLTKPYWIIDVLPMQVPKDSPGQYFAVDSYIREKQLSEIKERHINLILKLNCYMDITVDEELNPAPQKTAEIMKNRYVYIMAGDGMILSEADDSHMTLFGPDEKQLKLVKLLAAGEGLYVWNEGSNN